MLVRARSASACVEKRTKPKPRLRFVSRSLTTTCIKSDVAANDGAVGQTYRLFYLAILLEAFSQRLIAGMPGQASEKVSVTQPQPGRQRNITYPMNSFVVGFCAMLVASEQSKIQKYFNCTRAFATQARSRQEDNSGRLKESLLRK